MHHMVGHLGGHKKKPGRFPKWVRDQSDLRVISTSSGSLVAELSLQSPPENALKPTDHGPAALRALLNWDGTEDSTLPGVVTESLFAISSTLSPNTRVWLGTTDNRRRVEIKRKTRTPPRSTGRHQALLQGWLQEVNWERHTAQLHDYTGRIVRLRFNPALGQKMRQLATSHVEVMGTGQFDGRGEWKTVLVGQVTATRSHHQPFDLEAFLQDPNRLRFSYTIERQGDILIVVDTMLFHMGRQSGSDICKMFEERYGATGLGSQRRSELAPSPSWSSPQLVEMCPTAERCAQDIRCKLLTPGLLKCPLASQDRNFARDSTPPSVTCWLPSWQS